MATRREVTNLTVHTLKQKKFKNLVDNESINDDELYMVVDGNEKTQYGDLYGNVSDQKDLVEAMVASRIYPSKEMMTDKAGFEALLELKNKSFATGEFTAVFPEATIVIPYTIGYDGCYIADIKYKNQVDRLYDLSGDCHFFLIDEENKQFRTPLQSIYGMIDKGVTKFTIRDWED